MPTGINAFFFVVVIGRSAFSAFLESMARVFITQLLLDEDITTLAAVLISIKMSLTDAHV